MKQLVLMIILFGSLALHAQDPTINVQGVLRDADGNAVSDGEKSMIFKFYNAGGTHVGSWSEAQSVLVINGIYNVQLGSQTPLNSLQFNETYFLEITVDTEVMEPRIPLSLTPYSLSVRGMDNVFPSTGDVGIGTTSPDAPLHVEGNTYLNGDLGVGTSIPNAKLHVDGNTVLDGNVGIGTETSTIPLDVSLTKGNIKHYTDGARANIEATNKSNDNSANGAQLKLSSYMGSLKLINSYDGNTSANRYTRFYNSTGYDLGFYISSNSSTDPVHAMTLSNTGRLGIGSTSPDAPLDISSYSTLGWSGWETAIRLSRTSSTSSIFHPYSGLFLGFHTNDLFYFGNEIDEKYYMWLGEDNLAVTGTIELGDVESEDCDCTDSSDIGKIRFDGSNGNFYGCSNDANDNGTIGDYGWVKLNE